MQDNEESAGHNLQSDRTGANDMDRDARTKIRHRPANRSVIRPSRIIQPIAISVAFILSPILASAETPSELLISARRSVTAAVLSELPAVRLRELKAADMWIERLLDEYPEASSSRRLLAGDAVAGLQREKITEEITELEEELGPCLSRPTSSCLFQLAMTAARGVEDPAFRGPALASVASTLARAGDNVQAEALLIEAITAASDNAKKSVIDEVRSLAAWVKADLGKFDEALALVEETQSSVARGLALNDIVKAHLSRNDLSAAETVLALAEENLSESSDDVRPAVQAVLAESYARANDLKRAIMHGYEAAVSANDIVKRDVRDTASVFAIRALAYAGEAEWASYLTNNQVSDASFRCVAHAFLAEHSAEITTTLDVMAHVETARENCPKPEESDDITAYAALSTARALALVDEFDLALEILRRLPNKSIAQAWGFGEVALLLQD